MTAREAFTAKFPKAVCRFRPSFGGAACWFVFTQKNARPSVGASMRSAEGAWEAAAKAAGLTYTEKE